MKSLKYEQNSIRIYDISHTISQEMPVYPGDPKPEFQALFTLGKDKVSVSRLVLGSHTGTHIDAPKHFIPSAKSVDKISVEKFVGEAVILDLAKKKQVGQGITDEDLDGYSSTIKDHGDILLVYTGTSDYWGRSESIRTKFSYLEPSAARWMVDHQIKCVGIDSFSVEKYGFEDGTVHKKLLSNEIGIIEGLSSNLKRFAGRRMFLVCLPLKLEGMDGSPARAVLLDVVQ